MNTTNQISMFDTYDDLFVIPSMVNTIATKTAKNADLTFFSAPDIDLSVYDHIIVSMSCGKDSVASLLHILDMGVDRSKVELWHQLVDGREGHFMDWVFMDSYAEQLAKYFDLPLYFSWLEGGFKGEMLKHESYSKPHFVETPDGLMKLERDTKRTQPGTRLRFPQQSASLQTRWCSSALKIDVGRRAINNQERFLGKKVLFITGERREESPGRSKYNQLEPHACDTRFGRTGRMVDAWRPVLHWSEQQIWDKFAQHGIVAPVPYRLGWSRSSCMTCIYNGPTIWATIFEYFPERGAEILEMEKRFQTTISRKRLNVLEISQDVKPIDIDDLEALDQATRTDYILPIAVPTNEWVLPKGAFGKEGCGSV